MAQMRVDRINVTLHPTNVEELDKLCELIRKNSPDYFGRIGRSTILAALAEVLIENQHEFNASAVTDNKSLKSEIKRVLKNAKA